MKWLATKRILIKSIVLPGNFATTRAAPRIVQLATYVRRTDGLISLPVIEAKTMRLLAGHDRIAALLSLKEKHVEARFWEGSAEEFREVQIIENLARRNDDQNALTAELVRIEAGNIEDEHAEAGTPVPSTQSVKREARERVAAAKGVTPEAVKKAEKRAAKKATETEPAPAPLIELPTGFEAFGLPVDPFEAKQISLLSAQLAAWDAQTTQILRQLTGIEGANAMAGRHIAAIRDAVKGAGHAIREAIPASLCFYCKGKPFDGEHCAACDDHGFVGRSGGDSVPAALKATGEAALVAFRGQFVPYGARPGTVIDEGKPVEVRGGAAKKRGAKVFTVDEDGGETLVDLDAMEAAPADDSDDLAF